MSRKLLVVASLLLASPAFGQSVQQSGTVTRGHAAAWVTSGVIGDGGSSASSPISSFGVTNNGGAGICVNSALPTSTGYNALCFGANTTGPATISLQNYGTATPQNLEFVVNGTPVVIPTGGQNFLIQSGTPVSGHVPCYSGTIGLVVDCGTSIGPGTQYGLPYYSTTSTQGSTNTAGAGQLLVGVGAGAPAFQTMSGDVSTITAGGVLTLGHVNGIPFSTTYAANGVLIGEGTNAFHSISTLNVGQCLLSQGASDPIWSSCASGSGSAGGSNTQVQFNSSTALGGSPSFTWVSPALTLGLAGTTTGQLALASAGSGTGTVTVQNPSSTSAYNFNLPTAAGSLGQPLLSGGGGSTAMSFGTLGIGGGGTNCSSASGTCLDNITGFSSTGFVQRTGSGSYTFSIVVPVSGGGTGLANGISGGILGFTGTSTIASSAALTANGVLIGGGAGATPTALSACTNGQLIVGVTSGAPACQTVSGDIASITSGGVATVANSAITVAKQANAAAWTLEGNFTGSSATPQFSTIGALTQKASPASSDLLLIQDQAASGALKFATVSSVASAGSVASVGGLTGSVGLVSPLTTSANNITIAGGTLGQALVSNGASPPSYVSGARNLLATITGSGIATLSDTTHITASYNDYDLVFENILCTSGSQTAELQINSGGVQSTGYLSTVIAAGGSIAVQNATTFIQISATNSIQSSGAGLSGTVTIYNATSAGAPKNVTGNTAAFNGTANWAAVTLAGAWNGGNAALSGFQVLCGTGNITGIIKLYGRL